MEAYRELRTWKWKDTEALEVLHLTGVDNMGFYTFFPLYFICTVKNQPSYFIFFVFLQRHRVQKVENSESISWTEPAVQM